MDVLLAYNPNAGSFDASLIERLREKLTAAGHIVLESDSHSADLKKVAAACQHVCVIGGDGTLRDVIAAVADDNPSIVFSQFPLGTINLVAREAGYKKEIDALVRLIGGNDVTKDYHIAKIDGNSFLACASVGPDAWSVSRVSLDLKKKIGRFAYGAAFMQQLWNWKRQILTVQADGNSFSAEAAYILKGRYFAGPWILSETAGMTNPKLSILLMPTARRRDFVRLMASVMISAKLGSPNWTQMECNEVNISSEFDAPIQADGDIVGYLPAQFAVRGEPVKFA